LVSGDFPENGDGPEDEGTAVVSWQGLSPAAAQGATPFLIFLAGDDAGKMIRVDDEVTVGRGANATLRLTGDGVSRLHARFYRREGATFVEDLGSTNGTFINGIRLNRAAPLNDGDKIQIGAGFLLKFSLQDALEQNFQEQLYEAASRDALTKVFNRRAFMDRLESELAHYNRHGSALTVMMLDLDFFKRVNDTYGHLAGDHVLRTFAQLVQGMVRREDFFARYGGEEFVMLCRSTDRDQAGVLAERIRSRVQSENVVFEGTAIPITVSIGIAGAWADCTGEDVLSIADAALYEAKRGGRNRVVSREKE
jgi:diguanylate cyclase (GGDEF)-like protein